MPTKVGNTNNDAATNGQSLHTRRHWFAAKSPSWRSRTRSGTPHGTPPKEAAGRRVKHKKMQIAALMSHRATALIEWRWSLGRCSRAGPMDLIGGSHAANSCRSAFASFRSRVSNPSVNHPYTGASSSRACCSLPSAPACGLLELGQWVRPRKAETPLAAAAACADRTRSLRTKSLVYTGQERTRESAPATLSAPL